MCMKPVSWDWAPFLHCLERPKRGGVCPAFPTSRPCPIAGCGASRGPPCPQPQTPHLEEDLKEVLRSEAGLELIVEDEVRPEKQKRKAGVSGWAGGRAPGRQPWHRGQGRVEPWQGEERLGRGVGLGTADESEVLGKVELWPHALCSPEWLMMKPTKVRPWGLGPPHPRPCFWTGPLVIKHCVWTLLKWAVGWMGWIEQWFRP